MNQGLVQDSQWSGFQWQRFWCFCILLRLFWPSLTLAQIAPDGTLPVNSTVTQNGNIWEITDGTQAGSNLFHSFEQFSVPTGSEAFFNHALTVDNIITRITGGQLSYIDGLIRANGNANLFLINPSGLVFGPNASLNIGGSFLGSTAEKITFADGTEFSANVGGESESPLLSVNVPIGLQVGTSPGAIQVQGSGNNLRINQETWELITIDRPAGFQVAEGQTLALIGGDITLTGGNLTAPGGRIELASVKEGQVDMTLNDSGFEVNYESVANFGNITLQQAASVSTSGNGGGSMQIFASQLRLVDRSAIFAATKGSEPGGDLTVQASELVELTGVGADEFEFSTFLTTNTVSDAPAGNLHIFTPNLIVQNGAFISSDTFGPGDGGDLTIETNQLTVSDGSFIATDSLSEGVDAGDGGDLTIDSQHLTVSDRSSISADTSGSGAGGYIEIESENLTVSDGSWISADTSGAGEGGYIDIENENLTVSDGSFISADSLSEGVDAGDGGYITIVSENLTVSGNSFISTDTFGSGWGGYIEIESENLTLSDRSKISSHTTGAGAGGFIDIESENLTLSDRSSISADTYGAGAGGYIDIYSENLTVSNDSSVSADTYGAGIGGNLTIESENLTASDRSYITANTYGAGIGGNLTIESDRLTLSNGSQIVAFTGGSGFAGELTITAQKIELIGRDEFGRSGLFASALDRTEDGTGTGAGGDVNITTDQLIIRDGATVNASNFQSMDRSSPGKGPAGRIQIQANSVLLDNDGIITAKAAAGDQGNIILNASDIQLRGGSTIITEATGPATGGNITINTDNLAALEDSDINANAEQSFGGRVIINAQGIFGTEFRQQNTPYSDITATSELGAEFNGVVEIKTPDVDPMSGLLDLPQNPVDVTSLLGTDFCSQVSDQSEFIITGRGGIAPNPTKPFTSESVILEWWDITSETGQTQTQANQENWQIEPEINQPIIEAQGWIVDQNGEIILTATPQNVTPTNVLTPVNCSSGNE